MNADDVMDLVADAVTGYRITRLITADTITEPIRDSIIRGAYYRAYEAAHRPGEPRPGTNVWRDPVAQDWGPPDRALGETLTEATAADPDAPKLATLVTCRWCAGVWVAAGVVVARAVAPRAWSQIARAGVVATAAVLIARAEDN